MRREVAQIFFVELAQRGNQRLMPLEQVSREGVGLVFVATGQNVKNRRKPECHKAGQQANDQQRGGDSSGRKTETVQEPRFFRQDGREIKKWQGSEERESHHL